MFIGGNKARAVLGASALVIVLGAAGCSSGGGGLVGGGTSTPSWGPALGSGVTIDSPGPAAAGNGSPQAVLAGVETALSSGHYSDACKYFQPSAQSQCNTAMSAVTPAEAASGLPSFKNFGIGYTAIKGNEALVGSTGTVCDQENSPACYTNTDPAAILDSGQSFDTLWTAAGSASSSSYSLSQVIEVNGSWYAYSSSGT